MDRILFLVLEYIRKLAQVFTICKATERGGGQLAQGSQPQGAPMGRSKKDPFPTHRGNFRRPGRGGGESSKECLKFI